MPPVRQTAAPTPAPPTRAPAAPPPRTSSAARLQKQVGNSGMRGAPLSAPAHGAPVPGRPAAGKGKPLPAHPRAAEGAGGEGAGAAAAAPAPAEPEQAAGSAKPVAVALHMPEPPPGLSPASRKRIQAVQSRAGAAAAAKASLPPADKQVGDARGSVTPPEAERAAAAQAAVIAKVKAAPSPEIVKLCEHIRQAIKERRPTDQDSLEAADPQKEAEAAGSQLNATVTSETQKVEDNYGAVNDNPAPTPAAKAPDLPPAPEAKPTAPVDGAAAKPDAVPAENLSLDKDAEESRQRAQQAGMDTPAAQLVKKGPIADARSAQGELDRTAEEGPAAVLAKQEQALGKAEADMASLAAEAVGALNASRQGTVRGTGARKKSMVGSEESMRREAGEEAGRVFAKAQSSVQGLLKNLPQKALAQWEQAKNLLVLQFKADLKVVQDRVDERHSGFGGGLVAWWDDKVGLPDWATEGYDRAENNFADGVIKKLLAISSEVNGIIQLCDDIIANARTRIDGIYDALPLSLRGWADQEKARFGAQLDHLHDEAMAARDGFNKEIKRQASEAVNEVRNEIAELRKKAAGLLGRIADAIARFIDDPWKFILEGLLDLLGIPPAAFWAVVAKIKKAIKDIAADPKGFGDNLLKGLSQGFGLFFDNFGTHLIKGFLTWLLGDLKGVQLPKDLSLKSIATFFLQLMGISWANIRKILVDKIGAKNVALIEKVWSLVSVLTEKGPEGIYEMIKEKLNPQAIVDQVIQMAVDYMVESIVKAVAARILLMFNPAGAIIQVLEAIYRVLKWVFENAARIFHLIEAVVDGIADVIAGNVAGFAKAVESALAMLIPPVISFLADYLSFGDLPQVVAKKVEGMQKWVLGLIEQAIDWIIAKGKALLATVGIGKKEEEKKKGEAGGAEVGETVAFSAADESHKLWIEVSGDHAVVMIASVKKSLEAFLSSDEVKKRSRADPNVGKLATTAKGQLDKLKTDADGVLKALKQISDEKSGAAGGKAPTSAEKVAPEERALAETLKGLLDAMKVEEPVAGKHGDLCALAANSKQNRESHHVPAKNLGSAIAEFLANAAAALRRGAWRDNPRAKAEAAKIAQRSRDVGKKAKEPANLLSAILISYAAHKGDYGVHSRGFAEVIQELEREAGDDGLIVCKTKVAKRVKEEFSYISVNPQMPGWREFLADVRRQLTPGSAKPDSSVGRGNRSALQLILAEAEAELEGQEKASNAHLDAILEQLGETLDAAPAKGFELGRSTVGRAMEMNLDGTPAGQAKALADLKAEFLETWQEFRDPIR